MSTIEQERRDIARWLWQLARAYRLAASTLPPSPAKAGFACMTMVAELAAMQVEDGSYRRHLEAQPPATQEGR